VPGSRGRSLRARLRAAPVMGGLRPVRRSEVTGDVLAGITVAAVSIPVALGYAKIAGMPVVTGLYTLLLPMAVFAILGSSRHLVVGADSATAAVSGCPADRIVTCRGPFRGTSRAPMNTNVMKTAIMIAAAAATTRAVSVCPRAPPARCHGYGTIPRPSG
jgi:MFS superfamily sulfate permease-like transporter